jgi:hypothetical protein
MLHGMYRLGQINVETANKVDVESVSKIIRTICEKQEVLNILIFWTFQYFMSKYKSVSNFLSNNNAPVISLMSVIPQIEKLKFAFMLF